ncbi:MAG: hypothetical protein R3215_17120 [Halomonas sp.]|nr:hypothetical protein [Halomonas sp.]
MPIISDREGASSLDWTAPVERLAPMVIEAQRRCVAGRHLGARAGAPTPDRPIPEDSLTARLQRLYHRVTRGELGEDLQGFAGWLTAV